MSRQLRRLHLRREKKKQKRFLKAVEKINRDLGSPFQKREDSSLKKRKKMTKGNGSRGSNLRTTP